MEKTQLAALAGDINNYYGNGFSVRVRLLITESMNLTGLLLVTLSARNWLPRVWGTVPEKRTNG